MRKLLWLALVTVVSGSALADDLQQNGNSWKWVNPSSNSVTMDGTFKGCIYKGNNVLECNFVETARGKDLSGAVWNPGGLKIILNGGKELTPSVMIVGGEERPISYNTYVDMYKDVPVNTTLRYNLPGPLSTIPRINYGNAKLTNVPVAGLATTPTQSASTTGTPQAGTLSSTQAVIGGKAYTISFTNCTVRNNVYSCNSTVAPSK